MKKEQTNEWEEEFEERFGNWAYLGSLGKMSSGGVRNGVRTSDIKQFISKTISQEKEKMIEKIKYHQEMYKPAYEDVDAAYIRALQWTINLLQK